MESSAEHKFQLWQWMANIVILIFVIIVVIIFCQDHSKSQKEQSLLIGCSYMTMNNEFYQILNEQISHKVEAERDRIILRDPALNSDRQIEQINEMIDQGINALVVTPVDSSSLTEVLQRAKDRGIKVVVVDTDIDDESLADCTIVSDNYRAGYVVGNYYLKEHKEGRVVILTHEETSSGRERVQGFKDAIAANKKVKIVAELDCKGQVEIALPVLKGYIDNGSSFDSVFCLNDPSAVGAASALEEYGFLDKTDVYGVDGAPDVKALIADGKIRATAQQFPTKIGNRAAEAVYQLLRGEEVRDDRVSVKLLTKDNMEDNYVDRWQ